MSRGTSGLAHQLDGFRPALRFLFDLPVQFLDLWIELAQQAQQIPPAPGRPRIEWQGLQLLPSFLSPEGGVRPHAFVPCQGMQLVLHLRAPLHQLVPVQEQLPRVAFGRGGNPDTRELLGDEQLQQVPGIARIGLLFAHGPSANLGRIAHPQLVPATVQ